jgi:hypothetical protein
MRRSACTMRTSRAVAPLRFALKGGVLCRPTIAALGQQPGRGFPTICQAPLSTAANLLAS